MKRKPAVLSARASATDSGDWVGTSAQVASRAARGAGACDQTRSVRVRPASHRPSTARALAMVASILARLRTMPASASRRATSSSANRPTASGSKPANAARKAGRLRRMVIHARPDWNASRQNRSSSSVSPRTGTPHSVSWYAAYHDTEWGVPVRGETELLERFCLEAFQSGLAWITILRKRPAFRAAFAGFDPEAVGRFADDDVARLLADAGIVRN